MKIDVNKKLKLIDDQALVKLYIDKSVDESSYFGLIDAIRNELELRFTESALLEIENRIENIITQLK